MRTHSHKVGEDGDFWSLDLGVSKKIKPSYAEMREAWEATLEDCRPWGCSAKLLMLEVTYSIVSLHKERENEDKKGVRLSPWHIHILIYADGFSPKTIALKLKESWIKIANQRQDWRGQIIAERKKSGTWGQGCHTDVALESYQSDQHCYSRGKVAYIMWQAIHKKTYCWENHEKTNRDFSVMLQRLKLATEFNIKSRTNANRKRVIEYWIEWANNVKIALSNIPSDNNPYRLVDFVARTIHDELHNDDTLMELKSKIEKIPDIKTPAQWRKVYNKLVTNLGAKGVQGLIADGYEAILEELKDVKPLLEVLEVEGTLNVNTDGTIEVVPNARDGEEDAYRMLNQMEESREREG